jgi:hypothetical protein
MSAATAAIQKWAREQALPPPQKSLLDCLAGMANDAGECWALIKTLAKRMGVEARALRYRLAALAKQRLITVQGRPGRSNVFRLNLGVSVHERQSEMEPVNDRLIRQRKAARTPGQLEFFAEDEIGGCQRPVHRTAALAEQIGEPIVALGTVEPRPAHDSAPPPVQEIAPHPCNTLQPELPEAESLKDSSLRSEHQPALVQAAKVNNHILWKEGVTILWSLCALGETAARRVLGKLLREMHGDTPGLMELLRRAEREHPIAAVDWLMGAAKRGNRGGSRAPQWLAGHDKIEAALASGREFNSFAEMLGVEEAA